MGAAEDFRKKAGSLHDMAERKLREASDLQRQATDMDVRAQQEEAKEHQRLAQQAQDAQKRLAA